MSKILPPIFFVPLILLLCLIAFLFTGCVSVGKYNRDMRHEYIRGMQKARNIAYRSKCQDAVDLISGKIDVEEMKQ